MLIKNNFTIKSLELINSIHNHQNTKSQIQLINVFGQKSWKVFEVIENVGEVSRDMMNVTTPHSQDNEEDDHNDDDAPGQGHDVSPKILKFYCHTES